ncbi:MAG: hypothetical protein NVSMB44_40580 [Ktedonobacteraceae bacterium]
MLFLGVEYEQIEKQRFLDDVSASPAKTRKGSNCPTVLPYRCLCSPDSFRISLLTHLSPEMMLLLRNLGG